MNFTASTAIVVTLLLLSISPAAHATAEGPDFYAVRNVRSDDVLNMRQAPSAKARIVGIIPYNARRVENTGETFPEIRSDMDAPVWCKVRYGGREGWVACRFLGEDSGE